ncbi:MAG: DUF853 domain-containing protein, partial [Hyphomonadaceae bacterium]|nr:DUF853 domain-containing protein [Hyphomonadaceae bacterium]
VRPAAAPVAFWDVYGELGHPVRATVTELGPMLLGRVLDCSEAQEGALAIAFKLADDWLAKGDRAGLLLDLKDLRALLTHIAENTEEIGKAYGLVSPQTIAALQRRLLQLEMEGADRFFGEPGLELADLMRVTPEGKGVINLLAAEKLVQTPKLYATVLLWLLSELWEELPEVGDPDKPKLVFFFDEAHLLFKDAPKALLSRIEQVARLIRSKGVGVYFVTQSPADVPEPVLAQLGNRVQHALRAYTPSDQKAVRAAAASFRANPGVDVGREIQELGVGEALVSTLDAKGAPSPVARTKVRPPNSRVGPANPEERAAVRAATGLGAKYDPPVDRTSAYELLTGRADAARKQAEQQAAAEAARKEAEQAAKEREKAARTASKAAPAPSHSRRRDPPSMGEVAAKLGETAMRDLSRELMRGLFGGMKRKRR